MTAVASPAALRTLAVQAALHAVQAALQAALPAALPGGALRPSPGLSLTAAAVGLGFGTPQQLPRTWLGLGLASGLGLG